jgi:lipopolysaccharide biosynthesis glycosyltransferase
MIRVFIGFDPREAIAYHVCCQSIIENASVPVAFYPLAQNMLNLDSKRDGSNGFMAARFSIPMLCDYEGWAIYLDGDMVIKEDIAELWAYKSNCKAISVVPHEYKTKHHKKYIGTPMESKNVDYPKKNQSSVILWNCGHAKNRVLNSEYISEMTPTALHRFQWLEDSDIGTLSAGWNYLVGEQGPSNAHLFHYTLGLPGIEHYSDCNASWHWHQALMRAMQCPGESPTEVIARAEDRVGA